MLWANNVIPSLFPFFIATELLGFTNIIPKIGKLLNPIMRPIFNVPGCGAYAMLMGVISGYPIGAKIVTNFRENGMCSKEECERLLAFTNNSGPLFIIGTVGISLFGNSLIGILLFITHFLACLTVGILFRFWKFNKTSYNKFPSNSFVNNTTTNVSFSNLGEVLSKAISSATSTILMIGGFVVLFSVILSILENSNFISIISSALEPIFSIFGINHNFISGFVSGMIELTNGLQKISTITCKEISTNIILCAILLGFGGISILLQVFSIISKTDISIKPYIIGKILHGIFALVYTYTFISYFPIFNLNL
ncbi:MAG: sporulation integral membrane protein YlbJ [Clostridia bacterium]|nr:sporulation integral membrane protein YlbJ [Clostridia bacterium]